MTPADARPPAVAVGDVAATSPLPAVDLMDDPMLRRRRRTPGHVSVRRWALGTFLVLAVTLVALWGLVLAPRGGGSQANVGGSSQDSGTQVRSHTPAAVELGTATHRRSPIRRTSPRAS